MTVRDMHLEVEQSLQKVAANKTRKLFAEEIDWVLNKMQHRYIQQCIHPILPSTRTAGRVYPQQLPKYTQDQFSLDALKQITVSRKSVVAFSDTTERTVTYLPCDYCYLLGDSSVLVPVCNSTIQVEDMTKTVTLVRLPYSLLSTGPFYVTFSILVNGVQVNIPADLPLGNTYVGYKRKQDVDFIRDYILFKLRSKGVEVYWEKYGPLYEQGYLIFPNSPSGLSITIDGAVITPTLAEVNIPLSGLIQNLDYTVVTNDNRLTNSDQVGTLLGTPFHKTTIQSPISELQSSVLYTYKDNSFEVRNSILSYIRIPQTISLLLGTNCELSDTSHQTICDLAVEYLTGRLEDEKANALGSKDLDTRVII